MTPLQDETEPPPIEEPPPVEPPPETETPEEHDLVGAGGKCDTCGWEPGSTDPHPVAITPEYAPAVVEGTPEPPPPAPKPEPDPNACAPVAQQGTCPKCGWSSSNPETAGNPHPIL